MDFKQFTEELKKHITNELSHVENRVLNQLEELRVELNTKVDGLRKEMHERFDDLESELKDLHHEGMVETADELLSTREEVIQEINFLKSRLAQLERRVVR